MAGQRAEFRFDFPLDAEEVPEFHASRLLILLLTCGEGRTGLVRGRMKLAKLDFFIRYPGFLESALRRLAQTDPGIPAYQAGVEGVEADMIRYRYGPWDHRYYNLLSMLSARGLIRIGGGTVQTYSLTEAGRSVAESLLREEAFAPVAARCEAVARAFGGMKGTELKDFIYSAFAEEIGSLPRGAVIKPAEGPSRG